MKIAFNPSTVAALTAPPNNKDITFDLRGQNIFARGVKFYGTDTNTWRDIKINNVSIGSNILDLRNGSNTTLTNTNGVVTINSTWRPVVDNLTSDSTTSSLSANQGRVLAGLINGKSDSDHNHDDRYLKLIGGTLTGNLVGTSAMFSGRFYGDGDDEGIIIKPSSNGYAGLILGAHSGERSVFYLTKGNPFWRYNNGSTNLDIQHPKKPGVIALTSDIPDKNSWNYDDRYYTKAESDIKYITDITTSVNKLTFTKNGSSIARTITVNNVQSLGRRSPLTERNAISGIYTYGTYSATDNLAPTNYFETLGFGEGVAGTIEIGGSWISRGKLYWRALRDYCEDWFPWKTILDSSNYSGILDSRYYTESEVNSLLSKKLDRVNLSVGTWNPRGYNLAADYHYNGGDLSISENGGKMYVSIDGYFWQNEGQYRVLDISDVAGLKSDLTIHQYLSATDATWWPLIWGGSSHANTSDSTGAVYKSHDKLSWQTSSQTLYATNIQTENIKRLSIGGGIYWNPCVESTTDDTDAASITLVKSGVAGGTTLVLSQLNDANDTIQFQTNGAAKLYHNSYPILTTQNTYVNNRKGYIYGTEITQVNNSDTVDGKHASDFASSSHNHDGRYAISENYGGFTRTGRLPISGFYQSYESTSGGNAPWTSWIHLINCQHSNINNNYALQIAASFYDNNTFKIRVTNGNVNNAWKNIIHSGNIGAQSVNYANSAGNADKVDGYHATDGRTFNGDINWGSWNDTWSDGTNKHPWYGFDHRYPNTGAYSTTITDYFGMTIKTANTLRLDFSTLLLNGTSIYDINVASATNAYHLRINSANSWSTWYWAGQSGQPSWLWGSNDGTNMYVWSPNNFNVNTAQYLRSLGNQNCQTGRTQAYGDVYTYNTINGNTSSPTAYTSVIGFGRGTAGTVEIAGGWCNKHLYWRSLRDCCDDWYPWRTVLDNSNYTSVLNNTYLPLAGGTMEDGARISTDGDLYLGDADNSGWLYVQDMASQAGNSYWKIYANGTASFKTLTVNGQIMAHGFHHANHNSDDAVLLAGGNFMMHKTGSTSWSTAIQFGKYVWLTLQIANASNGISVVPTNISNPTKDIYVMNAQLGTYSNSRHGRYRVAPNGVLYYVDGVSGMCIYTTICYVAYS